MKRRGLLLDRDGVVNEDEGYIGAPSHFVFKPGLFAFLKKARDRGYKIAVVTNQSGVARDYYTQADYDRVTAYMAEGLAKEGLALDLVLASFTHPEGRIESLRRESFWRKPNPGMILEAALRLDLDLARSIMVGDSARDMQAAQSAGVGRCFWLGQTESAREGIVPAKDFAAIEPAL